MLNINGDNEVLHEHNSLHLFPKLGCHKDFNITDICFSVNTA